MGHSSAAIKYHANERVLPSTLLMYRRNYGWEWRFLEVSDVAQSLTTCLLCSASWVQFSAPSKQKHGVYLNCVPCLGAPHCGPDSHETLPRLNAFSMKSFQIAESPQHIICISCTLWCTCPSPLLDSEPPTDRVYLWLFYFFFLALQRNGFSWKKLRVL